jgi:hypothetical protein
MGDNINLRKALFPRLDPLKLATLLDKVKLILILHTYINMYFN